MIYPSFPPNIPNGANTLLSVNNETVKGWRNLYSLMTPSPPLKRPLPPLFSLKVNCSIRTGYRLSTISTSVIRV